MNVDNKPLIPYGWLRALLYLVVSVVLMMAALMLSGIMMNATGGDDVIQQGEESISSFLRTYLVIAFVFIGVALLMRRFIDRQSAVSLGFQWKGFQKQGITGFFLALLILSTGAIVLVLLQYLYFTGVSVNAVKLGSGMLLFILVAFTEEIAFRGYVLGNLLQSTNKWVALTITAFVFALFHFTNPGGNNWLPMVNIFVAGYLLGINYIYTRNLWFAIFLHFSWNFFQGPVLGFEVSGFAASGLLQQTLKGPALFTGGDFGFEGSVVCLALNVITCICLWRYYEKAKPATPDRLSSTINAR